MELLLPDDLVTKALMLAEFTFQYGATSTLNNCKNPIDQNYLHSNMELLLHIVEIFIACIHFIYIPIWSYFYSVMTV